MLKKKRTTKLLDELGESLFNATKIKLKNIKLSDICKMIYMQVNHWQVKNHQIIKLLKQVLFLFEYFNETEFKYLPNDYILTKIIL